MISFQKYLMEARIDAPNGIFVKMSPTTESIVALKARIPEMTAEDPHITLIYAKEPAFNVKLPTISKDARFKVEGFEIERFAGENDVGYIVLRAHSMELHNLHDSFREAGLTPTFPEYKPHVSLIHPAPAGKYDAFMAEQNQLLADRPLELTFFYGGYVILDEEPTET